MCEGLRFLSNANNALDKSFQCNEHSLEKCKQKKIFFRKKLVKDHYSLAMSGF